MSRSKDPPKPSSAELPHDEKVLALRPDVLLAKGKCDLHEREEKAVRGAVQDAISTYLKETMTLAERNSQQRLEMAACYRQSAEDAEGIIIRKCGVVEPAKFLKYRGRDCEHISGEIDHENGRMQNVLNNLINKRKQRMAKLNELQTQLATIEVDLKYEVYDFPEEEERLEKIEMEIDKTTQKALSAQVCQDHYRDFIRKLGREKWFYDARLENMKKFLRQDIHDLEVCHDVMVKGEILAHDASYKRRQIEAQYREEKGVRDNDIKSIRREVNKRANVEDRSRKVTSGDINIEKLLQKQQDLAQLLLQRRKTLMELENWKQDFEELQTLTRTTSPRDAIQQFQDMDDRNKYLEREQETLATLKQSQLSELEEKGIIFSSIRHTGEEATGILDQEIEKLQRTISMDKSRLKNNQTQLEITGTEISKIKNAIRLQLRNLKFVLRPQGWERKPGQDELLADIDLLRFKMISLQQRFDALGAAYRTDSSASLQEHALHTPANQFRVNRLRHSALLLEEAGRVDDMEPMRDGMKKQASDYAYKIKNKGRRPPK